MVDGIAEIDDCWNGLAGLGGRRERPRYSSARPVPWSSSRAFDACWESESESSWSEWSYSQDDPCCCDGDYAPTKTRQEGNNSAIGNQVNVVSARHDASISIGMVTDSFEQFCGDNHQSCRECRVDREPPCKCPDKDHPRPTTQKDKRRSRRIGTWQEERGVPPLEDVIYYLAKRQRHHNDEQRRIRDWLRAMGDLEGGDNGARVVGRERERCRYAYDRVERREPRRYEMSGGRSTGEEEEHHGRRRKPRFSH